MIFRDRAISPTRMCSELAKATLVVAFVVLALYELANPACISQLIR